MMYLNRKTCHVIMVCKPSRSGLQNTLFAGWNMSSISCCLRDLIKLKLQDKLVKVY